MSGEVISLEAARDARRPHPHSTGKAICLDCKHEWEAIAPLEAQWLECPACHLVRGRFKMYYWREEPHWTCNCGNQLFCSTPTGNYCPNCGAWQTVPE